MFISSHKRRPTYRAWVRVTAVVSLCYLLLASGRGLVPEICANLSNLPEREITACQAKASMRAGSAGCCTNVLPAPAPTPNGERLPGLPPPRDCAFCELASTPAEPLERLYLLAPVDAPACPAVVELAEAPPAPATPTVFLRGPPTLMNS